MHTVIVGGGIIGLCVARSLLERGLAATVIEQASLPNTDQASFDQHRLIRYQYGTQAGYARMVGEAFDAWERLWSRLGVRHIHDSGVLAVSLRSGDYADQSRIVLENLGLAHQLFDAAALDARYPHLSLPRNATGVLCHPGGPLYADRIVRELIRLATDQGALFRVRARAVGIDPASGIVTLDSGERITGDRVVVAAGAWLGSIDGLGYGNVPAMRQVLAYVTAPARLLKSWQAGPAIASIGDAGVYALPPTGGTGLKFGSGNVLARLDPAEGFNAPRSIGERVIAEFSPYLRDSEDYRCERLKVGYYVKDQTRQFRLDQNGRCLVITNCDGQMFKFGPLIGERVASALAGERTIDDVAQWISGT